MKRLSKQVLGLLLCCCLCLPGTVWAAPRAQGSFTVGQATGRAGDVVCVAVSVAQNPGLISVECPITYDRTRLRLVGVEDTGVFRGGDAMSKDLDTAEYKLFWDDSLAVENNVANGTVALLSFQILDSAPAGRAPILVDGRNALVIDVDLNPVEFQFSDGGIDVQA